MRTLGLGLELGLGLGEGPLCVVVRFSPPFVKIVGSNNHPRHEITLH